MMPTLPNSRQLRNERRNSNSSINSGDSSISSMGRGMKGILTRLRSVRRSPKTARKNDKEDESVVLDIFQNMKVRSRRRNNNHSDEGTSAMTEETSLSSAQVSNQIRKSYQTEWKIRPESRMREQTHTIPSIYSSYDHRLSNSCGDFSRIHQRCSLSPKHKRMKTRTDSFSNSIASSLYNAISTGQPPSVIKQILKNSSNNPSIMNDKYAMTILHCAIERYDTEIEVLRLLLAFNMGAASIRRDDGKNSVDLLWTRFIEPEDYRDESEKTKASRLRGAIEEICEPRMALHQKSRGEHALLANNDLREFWDLICDFIYAACCGKKTHHSVSLQDKRESLLFDCIELDCCPLLIRFVIALFSEQLQHQNKDGQLPLHLASIKDSRALKIVLASYPRAVFIPDPDGRLPLHLAIANKMEWGNNMQSLIDSAPTALTRNDPVTGLPPVLQAAVFETCDLTTIYSLMITNPMGIY